MAVVSTALRQEFCLQHSQLDHKLSEGGQFYPAQHCSAQELPQKYTISVTLLPNQGQVSRSGYAGLIYNQCPILLVEESSFSDDTGRSFLFPVLCHPGTFNPTHDLLLFSYAYLFLFQKYSSCPSFEPH